MLQRVADKDDDGVAANHVSYSVSCCVAVCCRQARLWCGCGECKLRCGAVCCSVSRTRTTRVWLQRRKVAVYCSVLQCVAVCCSVCIYVYMYMYVLVYIYIYIYIYVYIYI